MRLPRRAAWPLIWVAALAVAVFVLRAILIRSAPQPLATRIYDGRGLTLVENPRRVAVYENLIRQSIAPKSWKQRRGVGEISNSRGVFIVLQTPANHVRIRELFATLRNAGPSDDGIVTLSFDIGDFIDHAAGNVEALRTEALLDGSCGAQVQAPPTVDEVLEQIWGLTKDTISRESWVDNGGTVGTLHRFDRQLIVRQTIAN